MISCGSKLILVEPCSFGEEGIYVGLLASWV
jgi:hypothetical protein